MSKYQRPTEEQVAEVLRRIPTLQLRRAFFEGLNNPLWVKALAEHGAFSRPPEPATLDDGSVREMYWPEMNYLVRASAEVPADVINVLLKLEKSTNSWVRRAVFEIAASVPASQAVRLWPLVRSWVSTGFGWRTDPRHLVGFATNLLSNGQRDAGAWFADVLFKPAKLKRRGIGALTLDDYWYVNELPRVVDALGNDGIHVVLPWLVSLERTSGHFGKDTDISYFGRDSVRVQVDFPQDVRHALIDATRELAIRAMINDPEQTKLLLLDTGMLLARKIALFSLSQAVERSGEVKDVNSLFDVVQELLYDELSFDASCRIDYAELARSVALRRPELLKHLPEDLNAACARLDSEQLRQWVAAGGEDPEAIDQLVVDYQDAWMHRWLASVGYDALPSSLQARLTELDTRLGEIDSPNEPSQIVTSWVGPNSPLTTDEMSVMSPNELAAHLESWHDTRDGPGPEPSHEGQGRTLAALLAANPMAMAGDIDIVERLRPTYLRSIEQGWEAAVKAGISLDWEYALAVTGQILVHADESGFPAEGRRFDDDPDFRSAKSAAVGLLEELSKKHSASIVPLDWMPQIAELLTDQAEDETSWVEYLASGKDSTMDALTTSLNWSWPVRLRALTHLMSHGLATSWYISARSALEAEVQRTDTRGASRAVLGEGLGRLINVGDTWLDLRIRDWFGDEEGLDQNQQIALSTAIHVHGYHSELYKRLLPSMVGAIKAGDPLVSGWRHSDTSPIEQIGVWIIEAVIVGSVPTSNFEVDLFFKDASTKNRGGAMGHIAWRFMRTEEVPEPICSRFAELWDNRLEHVRSAPDERGELDGFYWVVKSGKFDVAWWLPRLREALELDPNLGRERYMMDDELSAAASLDPRLALEVLRLLVDSNNEDGVSAYTMLRKSVPTVIAKAIDSGDGRLRLEAESYMNELGERGALTLEREVQAARRT